MERSVKLRFASANYFTIGRICNLSTKKAMKISFVAFLLQYTSLQYALYEEKSLSNDRHLLFCPIYPLSNDRPDTTTLIYAYSTVCIAIYDYLARYFLWSPRERLHAPKGNTSEYAFCGSSGEPAVTAVYRAADCLGYHNYFSLFWTCVFLCVTFGCVI